MSGHKQDDSFRVIDRRLFTADGELRKEAVEEERRQEAAHAQPKPAAATANPAAPPSQTANNPSAAPVTSSAPASEPPSSPVFKNLLAFLARNAELVMSGLPDPRTGRAMVDLESLRQLIDMIEVLREKTAGNLSREDAQLLSDVLGDLKVSFLQLQQAAAAQQAQGAASRAGRKP